MPRGGFRPGAGRPKGSENRATAEVRAVMAKIAEANVKKFQSWIDRVAIDDPARAADLFLKAIEYHIPKLQRSELTGKDGDPLMPPALLLGPVDPKQSG